MTFQEQVSELFNKMTVELDRIFIAFEDGRNVSKRDKV